MSKDTVVLGLLGPVLDQGTTAQRWQHWRPTVSIGQHEDLLVQRLELIHQPDQLTLATQVKADFLQVSPQSTVRLNPLSFPKPWDFESVYATLLDFAKAYEFDPEREEYLVHITTGTHVMQICLFLLVESRIIPGKILQTGKELKDISGNYSIIDLDLSAYDKLAERFATVNRAGIHRLKAGIPTRNVRYNRLIEQIAKVSTLSTDPLLITGPSGVGKTRLARLIYEWKKDNRMVSGSLVELNCATLQGLSAMSALFGHVKGAYTGAVESRAGLLTKADGGLLFLDEIAELGLDEQAMLLRAIEEHRFYPLGSDHERHSDFQLICGTNRDLPKLVEEGRFREDLLFRINLWSFELMGLAERPEDLEPNLDYELDRLAVKLGKQIRLSKEARELFLREATAPDALWPGNFRELTALVTRLTVLSEGGRITAAAVKEEFARLKALWHKSPSELRDQTKTTAGIKASGDFPCSRALLGEAALKIDPFELAQLDYVLGVIKSAPSLAAAGRTLFPHTLKTKKSSNDSDRLRKYLERFGLDFKSIQRADG